MAVHSRHDYNAVDDSQRTVQPMTQHLGLVSIVVRDYDEAIDFYVNQLGFRLVESTACIRDRFVACRRGY